METNQYPNNPVPRGGDKIQITAANNSNATRWKAGDIADEMIRFETTETKKEKDEDN